MEEHLRGEVSMSARALSIARSVAVIGGTAALIAGVTFAATFQTNTVTLADTSFSTTSDNLRIWNGSTFDTTPATGFAVTLNPGIESAKQPFYLKNTSGANLGLTAHLAPGAVFTNVNDSALVEVKFYDDSNNVIATTNRAALAGGQIPFTNPAGQLNAGAEGNGGVSGTNGNYNVTFKIAPAGVGGTSASASNLDLEFTGTAL
jgi:hypothetical protein